MPFFRKRDKKRDKKYQKIYSINDVESRNPVKKWFDYVFKLEDLVFRDKYGFLIGTVSYFFWEDYKKYGANISIEFFLNHKLSIILKKYNVNARHFIELTNAIYLSHRSFQNGENSIPYTKKMYFEEYLNSLNNRTFSDIDIKICKILCRDFYFL